MHNPIVELYANVDHLLMLAMCNLEDLRHDIYTQMDGPDDLPDENLYVYRRDRILNRWSPFASR